MNKLAYYYLTKEAGLRMDELLAGVAKTQPEFAAKLTSLAQNPSAGYISSIRKSVAGGKITPEDKAKLLKTLPTPLVGKLRKILREG